MTGYVEGSFCSATFQEQLNCEHQNVQMRSIASITSVIVFWISCVLMFCQGVGAGVTKGWCLRFERLGSINMVLNTVNHIWYTWISTACDDTCFRKFIKPVNLQLHQKLHSGYIMDCRVTLPALSIWNHNCLVLNLCYRVSFWLLIYFIDYILNTLNMIY